MEVWNSLEVVKLIVAVLTPVSVFFIGWFLNRQLKQQEQAQQRAQKAWEMQLSKDLWSNQKLTEKKLLLYDAWAPKLNKLYCFYRWIGYWKDVTPAEVVNIKRRLDKDVNIYRYVIGESFYRSYQTYIHLLFDPFTGVGHNAKIRSVVVRRSGKSRQHEGDRRRLW